jgi:hypothetical protein
MDLFKDGITQNTQQDVRLAQIQETLKERDNQLQAARREIQILSKSKEGILNMINEKAPELSAEMVEKLSAIETKINAELSAKKNFENQQTTLMFSNPNKPGGINLNIQDVSDDINLNLLRNAMVPKLIDFLGKTEQNSPDVKFFDEGQKRLLAFFTGNQQEMNIYEDLMGLKAEQEEIKDIDWHFVLVFPNPDYSSKIEHLEELEADKLYDKCFLPDRRKKNNQTKFLENNVYKYALQNLIDVETGKGYRKNKGGSLSTGKYLL